MSHRPSPAEPAGVEPPLEDLPADEPLAAESLEERLALGGRGLREHTARGAVVNAGFEVGLAALSLLRNLGVAAFLTASEFGFWGLVATTLLTLTWLKQIGVADKYVQQDDADQVGAFQKAFTLELGYTLLFYLVVVAALPLYALIYDRSEIIVPGLVLSLALLGSALHTPIWIAYRRMQFVRQRSLAAVDPVVSTVVMIVLAVLGLGYWSLVIGIVAGSAAGAIAALVTCPYPIALRYDRGTLREYFRFGWPLFTQSAAALVVVQGSIIIGNYTVGLAGLGAIGLAGTIARFADRVDGVVSLTIYPAVAAVKERTGVLFELFVKSNRLALMWGLPFGIGLALFAPDLVRFVLGETWAPAEVLLQAFGLILGFRQVAFNWTVFMRATGNTRPMAVEGAVVLAVFAVVTAPAMFLWELDGYIVGTAATLVAQLAVRARYLSRLFAGFRILRHLVRAVAPSIPATAAILAIRIAVGGPRSLGQAAFELFVYVAITALATVAFERSLVTEALGYVRGMTAGRERSQRRGRVGRLVARLADAWRRVPPRERLVLCGAMVVAFACAAAYVAGNRFEPLVGDQPEYHQQGVFFTMGQWWWSTTPFGIEHASAWKAPLYPAWVGLWYELLGPSATRVEYVQTLLAPLTVFLTWLLARRLLGPRVAIVSAVVVAVFPFVWEWYGLLYPEALAIPLTLGVLLLFLGRAPTPRLAVAVGLLIGASLLLRPTSFFLFAGVAVAWTIASGWRRGLGLTAVAGVVAVLVVVPWTVRNYVVTDGGLVPISVQDGAVAGTFNEISANDPERPYAWRLHAIDRESLGDGNGPPNDAEVRSELQDRAFDFIRENPDSVPKAFFWNGITRFWDLRPPGQAREEVAFEGRSLGVTTVGLVMYYVLVPLALIGLWRLRRRRELLLPLVALAVAASIVFTVQGGTRYRAPLEPVIAILACSAVAGWLPGARGAGRAPAPREATRAAPRAAA